MLKGARRRCKLSSLEFDVNTSDFEYVTHCPVLNIPFSMEWNNLETTAMSIDRKDNTKGYVKGNVHIISLEANRKKSNSSIEELEKIIAYMKSSY
jgi:hypothetical protein